jgi:ComF family protein
MHHLPVARFENDRNNPAAQVFWGRVPTKNVITAFLYNKGNAVQHLIHNFKYRGRKDIGLFLGEQLGHAFLNSGKSEEIDIIVPVPLHPKKKKKRGFNQSEILAYGLSTVLDIEINTTVLFRSSHSSTQTRKSKYQRWKNVENIFSLTKPETLENKHILLVDDVITTGATLEACAVEVLKTAGVKISVGAVAFTRG